MRRALARAPRQRWRRTGVDEVEVDTVGGAAVVAISSFTLVLPSAVETDRVGLSASLLNLVEDFQ